MIVERIVATNFLGKYEKMNSYLGVILGVFVVSTNFIGYWYKEIIFPILSE